MKSSDNITLFTKYIQLQSYGREVITKAAHRQMNRLPAELILYTRKENYKDPYIYVVSSKSLIEYLYHIECITCEELQT